MNAHAGVSGTAVLQWHAALCWRGGCGVLRRQPHGPLCSHVSHARHTLRRAASSPHPRYTHVPQHEAYVGRLASSAYAGTVACFAIKIRHPYS
eukprot:324424-Pelagomonas_calceolata.AAC.1